MSIDALTRKIRLVLVLRPSLESSLTDELLQILVVDIVGCPLQHLVLRKTEHKRGHRSASKKKKGSRCEPGPWREATHFLPNFMIVVMCCAMDDDRQVQRATFELC